MEEMMETNERFASYEYQVKLLAKTKVPFSKWLSLQPRGTHQRASEPCFYSAASANIIIVICEETILNSIFRWLVLRTWLLVMVFNQFQQMEIILSQI